MVSSCAFSRISFQQARKRVYRLHVTCSSSAMATKSLVVVGSANADIVMKLQRVPQAGETVGADSLDMFPGGKGANQAAAGALLNGAATYFVGQVGQDGNGEFLTDNLASRGVKLDHVRRVAGPTGTAVIFLEAVTRENRIVIVGGANTADWKIDQNIKDLVGSAGLVLLQREIPESVNAEVASIAKSRGVPVLLDAGGVDQPLSAALLQSITTLSPNETELARITGLPTGTDEELIAAAATLLSSGVRDVLLKLGSQGSALVSRGSSGDIQVVRQSIIPAPAVVDTTGAGDCFTAAYGVAWLEGLPAQERLRFAAAAASLCIRKMGAMSSMPDRRDVDGELALSKPAVAAVAP